MPGKMVKDLYVATSMAELNNKTKIRSLDKVKLKQLVNSAKQLRESAKACLLEGDEEKSYVMHVKFVEIALHAKKMEGVTDEKFEEMFGGGNVSSAMNSLEELQESLIKRYAKIKEIKDTSQPKSEAYSKPLEENRNKTENTKKDIANGSAVGHHFESSISSLELGHLITEGDCSILVIDTRPEDDFDKSHMSFTRSSLRISTSKSKSDMATIINVPQDIIKRGLTPTSLEVNLPHPSLRGWRKRNEVDLIVLIDWDTEISNLKPSSTLYILKEIMTKWELNIKYKHCPVILDCGYFDWINTFPMMTTNPRIEGFPKSKCFVAVIPNNDVYLADLVNQDDVLDDLDDVVYPSLADSPPKDTPPPFIQGETPSSLASTLQSSAGTGQSNSEKRPVPIIDRSSKPNATVSSPQKLPSSLSMVMKKVSNLPSSSNELVNPNKPQETSEGKSVDPKSVSNANGEAEDAVSKAESNSKQPIEQKQERNVTFSKEEIDDGRSLKAAKVPPVDRSLKAKVIQQEDEEGNKLRMGGAGSGQKQSPVLPKREWSEDDEEKRKPIESAEKQIRNLKILPDREEEEEENRSQKKKTEKDEWITSLKSEPSSGSSIMKRSHSLQNVSRLVDDQECPKFNRNIKPVNKTTEVIATRRRNFDGIYGNLGRGLTGLRNLGNSCYMNSILQCINHTTTLVEYFCDGRYREDVNRSTKMRGEVAEEVAALVRALWSGEYRSIACRDLKGVVGMHKKAFAGYEQQDSHEFLTILMDWLHEDLNRAGQRVIKSRSGSSEASAQNASGPEGAIKAWQEFCRQNESLILQLFYGQQASTVRCLQCGEQSVTYEPFSNLSLPLPANSTRCTLADCMALYLKGEHITGWNCPKCKEPRDAIKKFDIWILPRILVIHFKRFTSDGWCRKRQALVEFPLEDLDASLWLGMDVPSSVYNSKRNSTLYNLYGVSNHYGTMDGGHYTAHCKSSIFHKWYKFDDHDVSELSPSEVVSPAAYILFYSSVDVS